MKNKLETIDDLQDYLDSVCSSKGHYCEIDYVDLSQREIEAMLKAHTDNRDFTDGFFNDDIELYEILEWECFEDIYELPSLQAPVKLRVSADAIDVYFENKPLGSILFDEAEAIKQILEHHAEKCVATAIFFGGRYANVYDDGGMFRAYRPYKVCLSVTYPRH